MNTMYDRKIGYYSKYGEEGTTEFSFNTGTTLSGKLAIINNTIASITDDVNGKILYHSIAKDIFFRYFVIKNMTDVDTSDIDELIRDSKDNDNETNSSDVIDAIEDFVLSTNIFEIVHLNTGNFIDTLYASLNYDLTAYTGVREDLNNILKSATDLVNVIIDKVSDFDVPTIMEAGKKLSQMKGKPDEEKIVKAFMETDEYKTTQDEIIENKNDIIRSQKTEIDELKSKVATDITEIKNAENDAKIVE